MELLSKLCRIELTQRNTDILLVRVVCLYTHVSVYAWNLYVYTYIYTHIYEKSYTYVGVGGIYDAPNFFDRVLEQEFGGICIRLLVTCLPSHP